MFGSMIFRSIQSHSTPPRLRASRTRIAGASFNALIAALSIWVMSAPTARGDLNPILDSVKAFMPAQANMIVVLETNPAVRDYILGYFPLRPGLLIDVTVETAKEAAKATGFNVYEDIRAFVAVGQVLREKSPSWAVNFVIGEKISSIEPFIKQQAPGAQPVEEVTVAGVKGLRQGERFVAFLSESVLLVGSVDAIKNLETRDESLPVLASVIQAASQGRNFIFAVEPPRERIQDLARSSNAQRFGGALYSHLERVVLSADSQETFMDLVFDAEGAAEASVTQIEGIIDTARGQVETQVATLLAKPGNPLQLMDPARLVGSVMGTVAQEFLTSAKLDVHGGISTLSVRNDKFMVVQGPASGLVVLGIAISMGQLSGTPGLLGGLSNPLGQ